MPLSSDIKFQKTLALAASASNVFEAEAAELAARRLMQQYNIDPTEIPDMSLYSRDDFGGNVLLCKLRAEWRALHPEPKPEKALDDSILPKLKDFEFIDCPTIPFNINGYRKHASKTKKSPRNRLSMEQYEKIRLAFNAGLGLSTIAARMGLNSRTVNSVRYRLFGTGVWVSDTQGKFQWVTAGQPGGERHAGSDQD